MSNAPTLTPEQQLGAISKRLKTSAGITAGVGIVVVALIAGYFIWGIGEMNDLIEPEMIVPFVGERVQQEIPGLTERAGDVLIDEAPNWAQSLSDQAIAAAPDARVKLEDYIMEQSQVVIDQAVTIGDDEFRKLLRENRSEFETTLDALANDQEYTDDTIKIFMDALNNELGQDMQDQAEQVLGTLVALREQAEKLSAGKGLTEAERQLRFSAMLARRLQAQSQDPDLLRREREAEEAERKANEQDSDGDGGDDAEDAQEGGEGEEAGDE